MSKVILICGKICSGKTFYANKIKKEQEAVILSIDEISLLLSNVIINEKFDEAVKQVGKYLFHKSLDIINSGATVILDWGFWSKELRDNARDFYSANNIPCELHYIEVDDETYKNNIAKRNNEISKHNLCAYYVDNCLLDKCKKTFEIPDENEVDFLITNNTKNK